MSGIHVDAATMNAQGMNTISSAEDLGNQITNLSGNVDSLMSIWNGIAATQFKEVVDTQIVNLREFQQLLGVLGEKITQGAKRFDETEQDNASRAAGLF